MSVTTLNPTSNTTPDAGQGGTAVTGAINTGHGGTTCIQNGAGTTTKSCIWTTIPAGPTGQIVSIVLKFDWSENGSIVNDGSNQLRVQYSTDGGGAWTSAIDHTVITSSASGTSSTTLSAQQDITQVQVRDRLVALGVAAGDQASVTASISNIKVEVTTIDPLPVVMI